MFAQGLPLLHACWFSSPPSSSPSPPSSPPPPSPPTTEDRHWKPGYCDSNSNIQNLKILVVEKTVVVIDNMLPIISPCHWNGQPIWWYIKHYTYYLGSKMNRMEKKCNVNNTRKRFFDIIFVSFCGFLVMNDRLSIQALNVIKKENKKTPPRPLCKICIKVIYFSNKHDTHRPQGIESFQPKKGRWYGIETV